MPRVGPLTLALFLLFANAATAGADPAVLQAFEPGVGFGLKGSGGYQVSVSGAGRRVELSVVRGTAITQYSTRGRASAAGVRASFGRFGRVDVEFRPSSKVERIEPVPGCRGNPAVIRKGVFVGTISFRGEAGYTKVKASSARGTFTTAARWTCRGAGGKGGGGGEEQGKDVTLSASCGSLVFGALGGRAREQAAPVFPDEDKAFAGFFAASIEDAGRVRVSRGAIAFARGGAFLFDEALTSATVRPPGPFHGSGDFRLDPTGEAQWTGTLAVSFPGRRVTLAGPGFHARLVRGGDLPTAGAKKPPCSPAG
jgi:hypothetical protein